MIILIRYTSIRRTIPNKTRIAIYLKYRVGKYSWATRAILINVARKAAHTRGHQAVVRYFMKHNEWYDEEREKDCNEIRINLLADLILYFSILEKNPKAFKYMKNIVVSI